MLQKNIQKYILRVKISRSIECRRQNWSMYRGKVLKLAQTWQRGRKLCVLLNEKLSRMTMGGLGDNGRLFFLIFRNFPSLFGRFFAIPWFIITRYPNSELRIEFLIKFYIDYSGLNIFSIHIRFSA